MTSESLEAPRQGWRFLGRSELRVGSRERPCIAGVLRHDTVADLAPDATVHALLPHDALLVVERTDPDLVLVETGALTSGGPWGAAGDPSTGDRGRRLVDIVMAARAIGRPCVLWWSGPRYEATAIIPMEPLFDLVVTTDGDGTSSSFARWSPGVQLGRYNPIGADPLRPCRPVIVSRMGSWPAEWRRTMDLAPFLAAIPALEFWLESASYPHRPSTAELPAGLAPRVSRWFGVDQAPDVYRSNGLFIVEPTRSIAEPVHAPDDLAPVAARTLAQLAAGARIVSRPDPVLAASLSDWVTWVGRAEDVQAVVAATSPLARLEVRALMRTLFEYHSTAAALRRLLRSLGLESASANADDVCAFVRIDPDVRVDRTVDDILRQRRRPAEAIFVGDASDLQEAVMEELRLAGISTSRMSATSEPSGDMAEAASRVRAGWLWPMARDRRYPPDHVLDLVIAAQISGAAAVGLTDRSDDGFVTVLPREMSLVARRSAARLPDPTVHGLEPWFAKGATLFGLGSPAT